MPLRMGRPESTRAAGSGDLLAERDGELVTLDGLLGDVQAHGRGRLMLISGEAGIGKSALTRAFCARWPAVRALWGPGGLTDRELEVLILVAQGLQDSEIAARLFMSSRTAGHHVAAILRKLDARTRSQAAAEAARLGIIER